MTGCVTVMPTVPIVLTRKIVATLVCHLNFFVIMASVSALYGVVMERTTAGIIVTKSFLVALQSLVLPDDSDARITFAFQMKKFVMEEIRAEIRATKTLFFAHIINIVLHNSFNVLIIIASIQIMSVMEMMIALTIRTKRIVICLFVISALVRSYV
jgi:hypothetical protein